MSIAIVLVVGAILGAVCAYTADAKNRSLGAWFACGLVFGLVALLALLLLEPLPRLQREEQR